MDDMMDCNLDAILAFTQEQEGTYTNRASDSGNWSTGVAGHGQLIGSNMGVGAPALIAWMGPHFEVTAEYMRNLPRPTYLAIARARYWRPMSCGDLPTGVDWMVFDYGWNRGDATSVRLLQGLLGCKVLDGDCGPETLRRLPLYGPAAQLVADLADAQQAAYRKLSNFAEYGAGWLRRTTAREVAAQRLCAAGPAMHLSKPAA